MELAVLKHPRNAYKLNLECLAVESALWVARLLNILGCLLDVRTRARETLILGDVNAMVEVIPLGGLLGGVYGAD